MPHTSLSNPLLRRTATETPMLTADYERELFRRIQEDDDPSALETVVASHLRLVLSVARGFVKHGVSFDDLVAEGSLALVVAARRFDPQRGARFSTYAAWWVHALLRKQTLSCRRIVAMPSTRTARRLIARIRPAERRLVSRLGREPSTLELAEELGASVEEVQSVEAALRGRDVPVDASLERGTTFVPSCTRPSPEEAVADEELASVSRRAVHDAIDGLDPRERMILRRRLADENETLASLGSELQLSRERVRQLEVRARGKLREALLDKVA
ncbi:MAG: RNA polymerase sigma factor RpoD/SigA [Sandaracinaceae bacterium]